MAARGQHRATIEKNVMSRLCKCAISDTIETRNFKQHERCLKVASLTAVFWRKLNEINRNVWDLGTRMVCCPIIKHYSFDISWELIQQNGSLRKHYLPGKEQFLVTAVARNDNNNSASKNLSKHKFNNATRLTVPKIIEARFLLISSKRRIKYWAEAWVIE